MAKRKALKARDSEKSPRRTASSKKTLASSGRREGEPTQAPSPAPDTSLGYLVRELHRSFTRSLELRINKAGITTGMWWFLRLLWLEDGLPQSELSDRVNVMGPTTARAMDRLERFGLITREASEKDKRKVLIFLTDKGRNLEKTLLPVALQVNAVAAQALSDAEMVMLQALIRRLLEGLAVDQDEQDQTSVSWPLTEGE